MKDKRAELEVENEVSSAPPIRLYLWSHRVLFMGPQSRQRTPSAPRRADLRVAGRCIKR